MHQNLSIFSLATAMARHAGSRQAVVAQNMANADTPGYAAKTVASFAESFEGRVAPDLRQSRAVHIGAAQSGLAKRDVSSAQSEQSPNGNSVHIEEQILESINASREHNRALTIYRHGLNVLRTGLGR